LFYLRQEDLFVAEYKLKFEELVFECDLQIHHLPTIYMFYNDFILDFKRELILHIMNYVEETFLLALELERSLKTLLNRRTTFKTRKKCSPCKDYGHHTYECLDQVF